MGIKLQNLPTLSWKTKHNAILDVNTRYIMIQPRMHHAP